MTFHYQIWSRWNLYLSEKFFHPRRKNKRDNDDGSDGGVEEEDIYSRQQYKSAYNPITLTYKLN
jgi:hypothetical protein